MWLLPNLLSCLPSCILICDFNCHHPWLFVCNHIVFSHLVAMTNYLVPSLLLVMFTSLFDSSPGGRLELGLKKIIKIFGTTCLRAAGSSPAPPAVWVFWHLIWRTESLDRGLILVCRVSFVSSGECIPVAAQVCSCLQGWMHVRSPLLLPNG
jgi:hypothetical protein